VEFVSRQSEISRTGIIMKQVEEQCKAKIVAMKTENKTEKKEEREYNVLSFRVVFAKAA
jgi:hypothetical protein